MIKCSFCEHPLVCKSCRQPFQPRLPNLHQGIYHSDEEVLCPVCQHVLVCKACGYVYGDPNAEDPKDQPSE
jgi:hypothetical protein